MRIRIDPADRVFSLYIRMRDARCVRCGKPGKPDAQGRPIAGLQCSHYFGRGRESTRFDPQNCDSLDFGCHQIWGSEDREGYRDFKLNQLGPSGFQALVVRANQIGKKDRKLALLQARELLNLYVDKPSSLKP